VLNAKPKPPKIAIVVPLLNEAEQALSLSEHLASLGADELILVDGGSDDQTVSLLQPLVQASGLPAAHDK